MTNENREREKMTINYMKLIDFYIHRVVYRIGN